MQDLDRAPRPAPGPSPASGRRRLALPRLQRYLSHLRHLRRALVAAASLFSCAWAHAQTPTQTPEWVTTFAAGQATGTYAFPSWTPTTLDQLARGRSSSPSVHVTGHLFLPPGADKVGAVVMMHGSGGVYSALLDFWPGQLNAAGFAVFTPAVFASRGVQRTIENQAAVPFAADIADAFAALRLLATHPRIDARRIAIMGFSRGGNVALRTAVQSVRASLDLPEDLHFAATIPVYTGGCTGLSRLVIKPGVFATTPMLFIHGDADDYVPVAPCLDYAEQIRKAGTPVEFLVIEGAHHGFDSDNLQRVDLPGATKVRPDCPIEVDDRTGAAYARDSKAWLQGLSFQRALKDCQAVGATVQGNRAARDKAAQAAIGFLQRTLGR